MKCLAAFSLTVLLCVPATAQQQQQSPQRQPVERELLDMEQEVDKALLREALMLQGRMRMKATPEARAEVQHDEKDAKALEEFIAMKKDAIIARAAELMKSRVVSRPVAPTPAETPGERAANRQAAIEKMESSQIEIQLLQTQLGLLREPLNQAVEALAAADLPANKDEAQRAKVEEARKEYDKIKARYVDLSKRLQIEQQELQSLQGMFGMGGMGMMGGMGGGMR